MPQRCQIKVVFVNSGFLETTVDCHAEVQSNYTRLQGDLQALASKIGELESEAEEHECVSFSCDPEISDAYAGSYSPV